MTDDMSEADGLAEAICPVDYKEAGLLNDTESELRQRSNTNAQSSTLSSALFRLAHVSRPSSTAATLAQP